MDHVTQIPLDQIMQTIDQVWEMYKTIKSPVMIWVSTLEDMKTLLKNRMSNVADRILEKEILSNPSTLNIQDMATLSVPVTINKDTDRYQIDNEDSEYCSEYVAAAW